MQDEIDSLASSRTADGDNSAHEGVITSLLNEMDGVQELQGVTIIAATNRPEIIVRLSPSKRSERIENNSYRIQRSCGQVDLIVRCMSDRQTKQGGKKF